MIRRRQALQSIIRVADRQRPGRGGLRGGGGRCGRMRGRRRGSASVGRGGSGHRGGGECRCARPGGCGGGGRRARPSGCGGFGESGVNPRP